MMKHPFTVDADVIMTAPNRRLIYSLEGAGETERDASALIEAKTRPAWKAGIFATRQLRQESVYRADAPSANTARQTPLS